MDDPVEPTVEITRRVYLGVPAEAVWPWLVEPEHVDRYHLANLAEPLAAPGDPVRFTNKVGWQVLVEGVVLEWVEGRRLTYSHQLQIEPVEPPGQVTCELIRYGEQMCCLEVRHAGLVPGGEAYRTALSSWDIVLSSLKTLVETGKPLPWPRRR